MRKESLVAEISKHLELSANATIRDEKAVKRLLSGFIKVLFPNLEFDNTELKAVTEFVVAMRQRVRDWLHKLSPGEFLKDYLEFKILG